MKRYLIAGLLVFFIVLIASFPARLAFRWFAPPDLQLTGVGGSVWNGNAAEALAGGAYLRDLRWTLRPSALAKGKLGFSASARPASGTLKTVVAIGFGGALELSDLSGNVALDLVHPAFQQGGIAGDLALEFESLVISGGRPVEANGSITVGNLYAATLSAAPLGDFLATVETIDGRIIGEMDDVGGVLDIEDTSLTIEPDGSYTLIGEVAPRPNAPPSVGQQLRFLPNGDRPGYKQFRFDGRF